MTVAPLRPSRSDTIDAPLALLGGTFDPVHRGHLRIALDTATALRLPEVRLIPSKAPVHRASPGASEADRLAMLRLAVADDQSGTLRVDDRELRRDTPSYTVLTLQSLRAEYPTRPLLWLIGIDAFAHIKSWYQWPQLFELAHFVVLNRPGYAVATALSPALADLWQPRLAQEAAALRATAAGRILLHTVPPQAVSATEIRNSLANGASDSALAPLLPAAVLAYIRSHHLYAPRAG
ncbi:MAG: nicotinate-nucleotide adenylyltransferase [Burkholderiales bacterium]|nr:nicotinate-nucleotide adenylyltransferase [Burkholderiales bacterium]